MKNLIEDLESLVAVGYTKDQAIELLKILEMKQINKHLDCIDNKLKFIDNKLKGIRKDK